jgi:hypothetical protein
MRRPARLDPLVLAIAAGLLLPDLAYAQVGASPSPFRSLVFSPAPVFPPAPARSPIVRFDRESTRSDPDQEGRACPGCPKRRLLRPYLESLALNVMYNGINHLRGHHTARIGFSSWWANMKHGWEWDANPWLVNQIGHPYQGSNYFTAARANGLSFWEATSVAAFGSATWEFYAENNRASLNDLVNTTLGGIALGEILHRIAWVVRDPSGPNRTREMVATAIDPMNGLTRMLSGDGRRRSEKPAAMIPSALTWRAASGVMWQGSNAHEARATTRPFFDLDVEYGDLTTGRSRIPYEAFALAFSLGGGGTVSQAGIRGRLYSRPFTESSRLQFTVFQTFDFIENHAYDFGAQGVELEAATTRPLPLRTSLRAAVTAGVSILAAVDSLLAPPVGAEIAAGAGSDGSRQYDYGPGGRWGVAVQLARAGTVRVSLSYQAYHVSVVDGTRSNHVLQRLHLDLRQPLRGPLLIGAAGEFFFRKAYFWDAGERTDGSPQFRVFLAWSPK